MFRGLFMRLCGFLGHDCLLCNRSLFNKNTEAESPDDHCHLLLRDGPADTPAVYQNALHQRLFREKQTFIGGLQTRNVIVWLGRLGGRHMPHVVVMAHGTRPLSAAVCADEYLIL